jgi:hypothetical protein
VPTSTRLPRLAGSLFVFGAFACTASASTITIYPDGAPELEVMYGQNLQNIQFSTASNFSIFATITPIIDDSVLAVVRISGYVTMTGGTGDGIMLANPSSGCSVFPPSIPIGCVGKVLQATFPRHFTFGQTYNFFEELTIGIGPAPLFAYVTGGTTGPNYLWANDLDGNLIDSVITFSLTDPSAVNNPEPATWTLMIASGMLIIFGARRRVRA